MGRTDWRLLNQHNRKRKHQQPTENFLGPIRLGKDFTISGHLCEEGGGSLISSLASSICFSHYQAHTRSPKPFLQVKVSTQERAAPSTVT